MKIPSLVNFPGLLCWGERGQTGGCSGIAEQHSLTNGEEWWGISSRILRLEADECVEHGSCSPTQYYLTSPVQVQIPNPPKFNKNGKGHFWTEASHYNSTGHHPTTLPIPTFNKEECSSRKAMIVKKSYLRKPPYFQPKKISRQTMKTRTWGSLTWSGRRLSTTHKF